jgi:flagellar biosynthetic protein FlhB
MDFSGEKTEQPTHRRLEAAAKRGQWPRSAEVQTILVLFAALLALAFAGPETWRRLVLAFTGTLGRLHEFQISLDAMQGWAISSALVVAQCVAPLVIASALGGLLAGGIQTRFQTASEALRADWERVNPVAGLKRLFSVRQAVPTLVSFLKLVAIIVLTYTQVRAVLEDPIFGTPVSVAHLAEFLARSGFGILTRVGVALMVIAAIDYTYQYWRVARDLMMTREEVKEEAKHTEGNPQIKSRVRRRLQRYTQRRMFAEVPRADVVVTNPTRLAIALRYDRAKMKAPKIVAKGARLTAQRIREIAQQHQVPIIENQPLARLMFKYGRVGAEIPAQFYAAVAEILAWVYRVNRFRYYAEGNQVNVRV